MSDGVTVTVTGDKELIAELDAAITHVVPEAMALVSKGALNIKTDWRQAWSGFRHAPQVGRAVTYDVAGDWHGVSAEIGPDKDKPQGALGNLLEYGSLNNAPHPGGGPALAKEEPRLTAAAEALLAKLLP